MELLVFAIAFFKLRVTLKGQNNTFTHFVSACQIIVIFPLAKSKHLNNNKLASFDKLQTFLANESYFGF